MTGIRVDGVDGNGSARTRFPPQDRVPCQPGKLAASGIADRRGPYEGDAGLAFVRNCRQARGRFGGELVLEYGGADKTGGLALHSGGIDRSDPVVKGPPGE